MQAVARILSKNLAETEFEEKPMEPGMKKALELYSVKKISVTSKKYIMEGDL